jgi:CheY-like chemotaxis protein
LIVDDDADTREMYAWCLEALGFRVALASSSAAALAQVAVETPDALVTDYVLPGGDGLALAATLRQAPATRNMAMLLVSGRDCADEMRTHAAWPFDRVLVKPVLPDDLAGDLVPLIVERRTSGPRP